MICPHASPVPFTSIWKPYSTIRPITGIATRSWGLLRSSRSASARYAGSMAGKRRYSSTGTPRNTTGKHTVGIPPQGSRHSTTGYLNYRQVVQGIPTVGSSCTTQWYVPYLSKVLLVPNCGTDSTKQGTDRQQGTQYEFTNIFSLSLFPVSAGLYKTET